VTLWTTISFWKIKANGIGVDLLLAVFYENLRMQVTRCFDIGGTKIVAADVTMDGKIYEIARVPTPTDSFTDFQQLLHDQCPDSSLPIGIAIAGVIEPDTGLINSANIPCLSGKKLSAELSDSLNREVYVVNDANAFALAQATFGKACNHNITLAIILGTGVGGGIVAKGKLLDGFGGTTGEWGHGPASTARTGAKLPSVHCQCGQMQCLDALGSARGLERLYTQICSEELACESVIEAWKNGNAPASEAVNVWLDIVGGALSGVVNFLGPSIVVVGGGLANAESLIRSLDQEIRSRCLANYKSPLLHTAVSGPEQGLLGAAIYCHAQSNP